MRIGDVGTRGPWKAMVWTAGATVWACAGGQSAGPMPPAEVSVERLIPSVDSMREVSVTTKMTVRNPRDEPVVVEGVRYSVRSVEGPEWTVENQLQAGQSLPAGQTVQVALSQPIELPSEDEAYLETLRMDTVPVVMQGVLRLADGTETQFEKKGSIAAPNLPRFIVHDAQAAVYEEEGIEVTFYLRLINENPFSVVVESAEYAISLEGKKVSEGTAGIGVRLAAAGVQQYEVNVNVDEETFGAGYKDKMSAESLSYQMEGSLLVQGMTVPVTTSGDLRL